MCITSWKNKRADMRYNLTLSTSGGKVEVERYKIQLNILSINTLF